MTVPDPHSLLVGLLDPLRAWLPNQRWFTGKSQELRSLRVHHAVLLLAGNPSLVHGMISVETSDDRVTDYQIVIGVRPDLPEQVVHASIGKSAGLYCYDAIHDVELTRRILELFASNATVGPLDFTTELDPSTGRGVELVTSLRSRPIPNEQSNTSLVFGQRYILKLFRKLSAGPNPDLDLHRALLSLGSPHIARPLGAVHARIAGETFVLGVMHEFLSGVSDGWAMATASVRDLMMEGDLHAEEVGGDFAGEARRLGKTLAEVHADLRTALGEGPAQRWADVANAMHQRLDSVLGLVPELAPYENPLREIFARVQRDDLTMLTQYIHGDLHLGQVLRTAHDWVLIDFEGEPDAPLAERNSPRSPLRDVAGMLRSFDYAAHHRLVGQGADHQLAVRAREWSRRNQTAFREGYAATARKHRAQEPDQDLLLRAFELDKAVYEVCYEHGNRPEWLPIPLAAIARIATGKD